MKYNLFRFDFLFPKGLVSVTAFAIGTTSNLLTAKYLSKMMKTDKLLSHSLEFAHHGSLRLTNNLFLAHMSGLCLSANYQIDGSEK